LTGKSSFSGYIQWNTLSRHHQRTQNFGLRRLLSAWSERKSCTCSIIPTLPHPLFDHVIRLMRRTPNPIGQQRSSIALLAVVTTKDGSFIDNGEFPLSIGAFTTIPKAPRGKAIDRTTSKFLDIVHLDIAFGDCMSVGGFKYALIFVDRATRFNWCFGLKSLHHDDIITAFMAFRSNAGSLARQFRCDCDEKLFGSHVCSFLHLDCSSIASSPAGRQSANGLVESHWKIMVHMP